MSDDPIGGLCSIAALGCLDLCVGFYMNLAISRRTYMYPCDCCCPSSNCCGRCEDPDLPDRVEGGRDADSDSDTYVGSDGNIRKKTAYHDPERAPLLEHDGRVGGGGAAQIARTISVQPMAQPPINSDPTNARDLSNTT